MPIPLIIGAVAVAAGLAGAGAGVKGAIKVKEANDTLKQARSLEEEYLQKLKSAEASATWRLDMVGRYEMEILSSFKKFSDIFEKIKNKPEFAKISTDMKLQKFTLDDVKDVAIGAQTILGALGGAGTGVLGGLAASGATTAAITTLCAASTGTAISSLSGAAATNAVLAVLGGGTLAAGGGGVALGTAILGGATLGVGLLVGGLIFNFTGSKLSKDANKALEEARENDRKARKVCAHLETLKMYVGKFHSQLAKINERYVQVLGRLDYIVNSMNRVNYSDYTHGEKQVLENAVLLVHLLYNLCKVQLIRKTWEDGKEICVANVETIEKGIKESEEKLNAA